MNVYLIPVARFRSSVVSSSRVHLIASNFGGALLVPAPLDNMRRFGYARDREEGPEFRKRSARMSVGRTHCTSLALNELLNGQSSPPPDSELPRPSTLGTCASNRVAGRSTSMSGESRGASSDDTVGAAENRCSTEAADSSSARVSFSEGFVSIRSTSAASRGRVGKVVDGTGSGSGPGGVVDGSYDDYQNSRAAGLNIGTPRVGIAHAVDCYAVGNEGGVDVRCVSTVREVGSGGRLVRVFDMKNLRFVTMCIVDDDADAESVTDVPDKHDTLYVLESSPDGGRG